MTRLKTPLFGFDYTSEINPTILHQHGVRFVVRYLSRYSRKVITAGEYKRLRAAGIHVALVFEDGAQNALGGFQAGVNDATFALAQAEQVCGKPAVPRPIFAAVDYDPAGDAAATDPYFGGWASVRGKELSGPYGGYEVVNRQANRGFGALFQTYAWSRGLLDQRALIYQYSNDHPIGPGVDFDLAMFEDFGQWDYVPAHAATGSLHYAWFDDTVRDLGNGRRGAEREIVREYDRKRPHWHLYPRRLRRLRDDMLVLSGRLQSVIEESHDSKSFHRDWRKAQLDGRASGKRYA